MTPVRLEPAALRSRVKHSTTEPLRSLIKIVMEITLLIMENHGKSWNYVFEFLWEPCFGFESSSISYSLKTSSEDSGETVQSPMNLGF